MLNNCLNFKKILKLMKEKVISFTKMAKMIHHSPRTLRKFFAGEKVKAPYVFAFKIVEILKVKPFSLFLDE